MNKVAGVVILYNPDDCVIDNIKSYLNKIDKLYIFDNGNGKYIYNQIKDSKVVYITESKNMGIAYALNKVSELAIKDGYSWLLTMDQDSKFENDNIDKLIKTINIVDDKVGIIAPTYNIGEFYETSKDVVMTSGNLLNLNIWKKINGFRNELFIDMVDYEYCLNLKKHNYTIYIVSDAYLRHNLGQIKSVNIFGKKIYYTNHNYIRRYYITRNRLILNYLYKDEFNELVSKELIYNKKELIKIILFENNKIKKIKSVIKGYKDFKKWRSNYEKTTK